jgi:F-type H+-transporting ATPase subunit b
MKTMTEFQVAEAAHPPVVGEGTTAEGPGVKEPFPPFDPTHFASQFLWFAITFVAFYFIIARVAIPRIAGILGARRGRIEGDLGEAERAKQAADAAGIAYEKALAEARARAFDIAEEASNKAKAVAAAERSKTEAALAKKLAEAETSITEIKQRALGEVGSIAGEAAEAVVKALSSASVTSAEIREAVGAAMSRRNG